MSPLLLSHRALQTCSDATLANNNRVRVITGSGLHNCIIGPTQNDLCRCHSRDSLAHQRVIHHRDHHQRQHGETRMPKISAIARPLKIGSSKMKNAPSIAARPVRIIGLARTAKYLGRFLFCNEFRNKQVLDNLVDNALKFSHRVHSDKRSGSGVGSIALSIRQS